MRAIAYRLLLVVLLVAMFGSVGIVRATTTTTQDQGAGQDMIGYLFPPGNFVGDQGETDQSPWAQYQLATNAGGTDRHGYHHSDDSEAHGPHAGLAVTQGIASLLSGPAQPVHDVLPGLFVDAAGNLSDGPFAGTPFPFQDAQSGFQGAAGIEVAQPGGGT